MHTTIRDNYEPKIGDYHNQIVRDTVNNRIWLFDCDGVYLNVSRTWVTVRDELGDSDTDAIAQRVVTEHINALTGRLNEEAAAREAGDAELKTLIDKETSDRKEAEEALKQEVEENLTPKLEAVEQKVEAEATTRAQEDINLQSQIDGLVASSDVKDVVGNYSELQDYDKSTLGDNDIIKVLQDETHDFATTYYRYSAATQSFDLIGEEGPYYTKAEADSKLSTQFTVQLTPIRQQVDENTNSINLHSNDIANFRGDIETLRMDKLGVNKLLEGTGIKIEKSGSDQSTTLTISAEGGGGTVIDALDSHDTTAALSANMGREINEKANALNEKFTTAAPAIGFDATAGYQAVAAGFNAKAGESSVAVGRNTSTTSASSVAVGDGAKTTGYTTIAVGRDASASMPSDIAIGPGTTANANNGLAIGAAAIASANGSIAIGVSANAAAVNSVSFGVAAAEQGEFSIGARNSGYKNSNYRLLTGLYDPQNDHDAATKAYVDAAVAGAGGGGGIEEINVSSFSNMTVTPQELYNKLGLGFFHLVNDTSGGFKVAITPAVDGDERRSSNFTLYQGLDAYVMMIKDFSYKPIAAKFYLIGFEDPSGLTDIVVFMPGSAPRTLPRTEDRLTSDYTWKFALSANQGKLLNDKITALEARIKALEDK